MPGFEKPEDHSSLSSSQKFCRTFHRASWLLPITSAPLQDGVVVLERGAILGFGPTKAVFAQFSSSQLDQSLYLDHGEGVIMPGLVNSHTHLELSCLGGQISKPKDFVSWVYQLIEARSKISPSQSEKAILASIRDLALSGVALVGDISNTGSSIRLLRESQLAGRVFLEAIGFSEDREKENWAFLQSIIENNPVEDQDISLALAAHAPYSVSPAYLKRIKKSSFGQDQPLAIHLAESMEETMFLASGQGPIKSLLEERGAWSEEWIPPHLSPVAYLHQLGLLSPKTICVHAVQVKDEDMKILQKTGASICLCPRSNAYLGVGCPPVEKFLKYEIPLSLGTDSLASNNSLSLWEEMAFLKQQVPALSYQEILQMATINGAKALGREEFGSLGSGKRSPLLFVPLKAGSVQSVQEMLEAVIVEGPGKKIETIL